MSAMGRPALRSMSVSVSTGCHPSAAATSFATVDLPVPEKPVRKTRL
jgi:hypothetical protein